ncbi:Fumarylacetoacetase [Hyphodiscus hymeniophilus]|uniref:Fumarylacetoacetase n=1 Tax=Hyphodiscus hymeniophilus TaxID=353542 RepID=A0A9P6VS20_9HELO|nr:Fumarylacetoacetase [Hyphodiscus hymeniophilus]
MAAQSWLHIPTDSHFSLSNIPFGIITTPDSQVPHPAVAIGTYALDLAVFTENNGFSGLPEFQAHLSVFSQETLNAFAALGQTVHRAVRRYLQSVLTEGSPHAALLQSNSGLRQKVLFPLGDIHNHLPMQIGDYTDFYAGKHHAVNVGTLFRDPKIALQPNYTHLPVGYHGRASSVVVTGTPLVRPSGQILDNPAADPKVPIFSPSRRLDIELELAAFVCKCNKLGAPVPITDAHEAIFGIVLMNDWSARDIQAWEYVPLGPFGSKNFQTTISPWVILADAMAPFMAKGLENESSLLPYLQEKKVDNMYDLELQVNLTSKQSNTKCKGAIQQTITKTTSRNLVWSFPQMLTHHTVTGCPMHVGDLLGSGTISGLDASERGSLLEQTSGGKVSMKLNGGEERKFLEDGDTITMTGWCGESGALVGFGDCTGTILPAVSL